MRRSEIPPTSQSSADDCEQQFYEALRAGDLQRVMSLWADDDEIACIHPGGQRLIGPDAIRASYAAMFRHGGLDLTPDRVRRLDMAQSAIHHVVERVRFGSGENTRHALVVATNVYVQGPLGWRLAAHHASPHIARVVVEGAPDGRAGSAMPPSDDSDDGPTTLH